MLWVEYLKTRGFYFINAVPRKKRKRKGIPGNCFLEPVGMDLMNESGLSKIAGAAMKRTKRGILIQGTINLESLVVDKRLFLVTWLKSSKIYFLKNQGMIDGQNNCIMRGKSLLIVLVQFSGVKKEDFPSIGK